MDKYTLASKDGRFRKIAQSIFNLWQTNIVNLLFKMIQVLRDLLICLFSWEIISYVRILLTLFSKSCELLSPYRILYSTLCGLDYLILTITGCNLYYYCRLLMRKGIIGKASNLLRFIQISVRNWPLIWHISELEFFSTLLFCSPSPIDFQLLN